MPLDHNTITKLACLIPFCTVGKGAPEMNFARLLETCIIAGVTMYGTIQVQSSKLDALAKVTEEMRAEVTAIRLERAGRVKLIDAELEEQKRFRSDIETRTRKLEQRR